MNTTDKDIINKIAYNENSSTKECCLTPLKMWESQAIKASQKVIALQKEIKKLLDVIAKSQADITKWKYKCAHAQAEHAHAQTVISVLEYDKKENEKKIDVLIRENERLKTKHKLLKIKYCELEEKDNEVNKNGKFPLCYICEEARGNCCFIPCMHINACRNCADTWFKRCLQSGIDPICPQCKQPVTKLKRAYL